MYCGLLRALDAQMRPRRLRRHVCSFGPGAPPQNPVRTPSGHCPSLIPHPPSGPRQSAFIYSIFYIIHKLACCDPRHKRKKQGTEEVEETEEEVEARAREIAAQMIQAKVRGNMVRKAFASRT